MFLQSMGLTVATEVRDVPINLSYQEAKKYSQIFKSFDKDKDGHISIHDMRKALHEMGEKVDDDQLTALIAEVDINKNCTIEEEEFLQVSPHLLKDLSLSLSHTHMYKSGHFWGSLCNIIHPCP